MASSEISGVVLAASVFLVVTQATASAATYPPDVPFKRVRQPALAEPAYLTPTQEPEFGTEITRIADRTAFGLPKARYIRHIYAKNQPFNANESLLMLDYIYPAPILDSANYTLLRFIHQPSRAVWSNLDPNTTYGTFAGTNKFVATDMRVDWTSRVVHGFTEYKRIDFGLGEGSLSTDDRYAAFFGVRPDGGIDLFVYDLQADIVTSRLDLTGETIDGAHPTINNATMSPSGNEVVIEYNRSGLGVHSGIVAYNRSLTKAVPLAPNNGSHYDVCTNLDGSELIVVQAPDSSAIIAVALADAHTTVLLPARLVDYPIHISCRNTSRRGWVYISEFAGRPKQAGTASYQSVFAVKLDGSGLVERFAHEHHSTSAAYGHEPMAVPNHAGDRVVFSSDWESNGGPVYDYVADQP